MQKAQCLKTAFSQLEDLYLLFKISGKGNNTLILKLLVKEASQYYFMIFNYWKLMYNVYQKEQFS